MALAGTQYQMQWTLLDAMMTVVGSAPMYLSVIGSATSQPAAVIAVGSAPNQPAAVFQNKPPTIETLFIKQLDSGSDIATLEVTIPLVPTNLEIKVGKPIDPEGLPVTVEFMALSRGLTYNQYTGVLTVDSSLADGVYVARMTLTDGDP